MQKNKLIELFKMHGGLLKSKDFCYQPPYYDILNVMIENKEVVKLKNGLFRYEAIRNDNEPEDILKIYPDAVLCLFSAWHYHQLSTTVPYLHHLAFEHKSNPSKSTYLPVKFYYWSKEQYESGVINYGKIRVYDIEKSVCDAVKFRNKVGEEITLEVIKTYMQSNKRNIDKLMAYSKKMRIEKIITPMLKALV